MDVLPERLRRAAPLLQAGFQHLLHEVGRAVGHRLHGLVLELVDGASVAVHNLGDQHGGFIESFVDDGAVAVDQLQKIHVARAQRQGFHVGEGRLDAHGVGRADDVGDAHFLSDLHGHGVDALGESRAQGHVAAREEAVGVVRRIDAGLAGGVGVGIGYPAVHATVDGLHALIHRFGVGEELEGAAGLAHRRHLVVFPAVEIDVAHPGLHLARVGLDGHEAAVEIAQHLADGVQIVRMIPAGDVLHEAGNLAPRAVGPGRCAAPVVVELLLHDGHLSGHGVLRMLLDAGVDGGVNLKTVHVEIQAVGAVAVLHQTFHAEHVDVFAEVLAEVGRDAVGGVLLRMLPAQHYGQRLERIELRLGGGASAEGHPSVLIEVVQDDVATREGVLGMQPGVVGRSGFEQTHQHGGLLVGEAVGRRAEIAARRRLDAEGVGAEVHRVEIHREDVLLGVEELQLLGHNPLLHLHHQQLHAGDVAAEAGGVAGAHAEEVLGQLLRDGGGAAGVALHHVLAGGEEPLEVHSVMVVEALVFGGDEGADEQGRDLPVGHGRAVFVVVAAHEHAVGAVDLTGFGDDGVLDVGEARTAAEEPEEIHVDEPQQDDDADEQRQRPDAQQAPPGPLSHQASEVYLLYVKSCHTISVSLLNHVICFFA